MTFTKGDGVAECYYFDGNGYMLANTTTPDGYQVNADGAWTENGVVQTQNTGTPVAAVSDSLPSTSEYDHNGISLAALDMLYGNRESNQEYGETLIAGDPDDKYGVQYTVHYTNDLKVYYYPHYYDTNAWRVWIVMHDFSGNSLTDGKAIFKDMEDFSDAESAVRILENKGYVPYTNGSDVFVNFDEDRIQLSFDFWNDKVYSVDIAQYNAHVR